MKLNGYASIEEMVRRGQRDTRHKRLGLENDTFDTIYVALTTYYTGPLPTPRFSVDSGKNVYLGVNVQSETQQYMWIMRMVNGEYVQAMYPYRIPSGADSVVIRGKNMCRWFAEPYRTAL